MLGGITTSVSILCVSMLSFAMQCLYAVPYAGCHYSECHKEECHNAELYHAVLLC